MVAKKRFTDIAILIIKSVKKTYLCKINPIKRSFNFYEAVEIEGLPSQSVLKKLINDEIILKTLDRCYNGHEDMEFPFEYSVESILLEQIFAEAA